MGKLWTTWSPAEDERLRVMWLGQARIVDIARFLDRSPAGVDRRRKELGMPDRRPAVPRGPADLTLGEIMVMAAFNLPPEFEESDLAIAAWVVAPTRFGMRGFQNKYVDTKTVGASLSNSKSGPVKAYKWIERVGSRRLRLTPLGRTKSRELKERFDA